MHLTASLCILPPRLSGLPFEVCGFQTTFIPLVLPQSADMSFPKVYHFRSLLLSDLGPPVWPCARTPIGNDKEATRQCDDFRS